MLSLTTRLSIRLSALKRARRFISVGGVRWCAEEEMRGRVVDVKARAGHGQQEEEDGLERQIAKEKWRGPRSVVGVALLIDALFERAARAPLELGKAHLRV